MKHYVPWNIQELCLSKKNIEKKLYHKIGGLFWEAYVKYDRAYRLAFIAVFIFFAKVHAFFYKQQQAEIDKNSSKS